MRCKKCHRKLTDKDSKDRGYGPICAKKLQSDQLVLFDIPVLVNTQPVLTEYESYPLPKKFTYQIQLKLNFTPVIRADMSALDKHQMVNNILGLK